MRVKIKDTTKHADYGELYAGDVLDVADQDGQRWVQIGLAEKSGAEPQRRVAADPLFSRPDAPEYGAMVGRNAVGDFTHNLPPGVTYPTNVAPEVQHIIAQKDAEIAALKAQLGQDKAALPADEDAKPKKKS